MAVKINQAQLIELLAENGGRQISVISMTDSRLKRKDEEGNPNPWEKGKVWTLTHQTVNPRTDYGNAVRRQQDRIGLDPSFQPENGHRNGSVPAYGWPFDLHKNGNITLRVVNSKVVQSEFRHLDTGETLPYEECLRFKTKRNNNRQGRAGLDADKGEQIPYRGPSLNRILQVRMMEEIYELEDPEQTP